MVFWCQFDTFCCGKWVMHFCSSLDCTLVMVKLSLIENEREMLNSL